MRNLHFWKMLKEDQVNFLGPKNLEDMIFHGIYFIPAVYN